VPSQQLLLVRQKRQKSADQLWAGRLVLYGGAPGVGVEGCVDLDGNDRNFHRHVMCLGWVV